jgi:hypothetical protein
MSSPASAPFRWVRTAARTRSAIPEEGWCAARSPRVRKLRERYTPGSGGLSTISTIAASGSSSATAPQNAQPRESLW